LCELLFFRGFLKPKAGFRQARTIALCTFGKRDFIRSINSIHQTETHIVPNIPAPMRLQEYGVGIFNGALTRSALKKAIKKKFVSVNGSIATTATFISGGESIQLSIPQEVSPRRKLIFPLEVLFEDNHLAVIHKPAGILVSGNSFKTITNALVQNLLPSTLAEATKPQPVHRLDYATTGVLLVGKTSSSIRLLNQMFAEKRVEKIYYAVTIGAMESSEEITTPIDGKQAQSNYQVIASVPSGRFGQLNLVKLKPQTGRRHQLRRHLLHIGNPILGDKDYAMEGLILKGKGLYLHAYSLAFEHPFTHKTICIKDELPEKFKKLFPSVSLGSL